MRLDNTRIDRTDKFYFDPIVITSPEQYVPLFLAKQSPVTYRNFDHDLHIELPTQYESVTRMTRDGVRDLLMSQLNHNYPKSYRLIVDLFSRHSWRDYIFDDIKDTMYGNRAMTTTDAVIQFGLFAGINSSYKWKIVTSNVLYRGGMTITKFVPHISPHVLIVVKAKYIPYLRARLYLDLPFSLPVEDLKVLHTATNSTTDWVMGTVLKDFITSMNPVVQICTMDEIRGYLHPPAADKSIDQVLGDAVVMIEEELETV